MTGPAIERTKASALAAFRAGRSAGVLDAVRALVSLLDDATGKERREALMDACECVSRLAHEADTNEGESA